MIQYILYLTFISTVHCQINGEFWWLNGKLNSIRKVRPEPPKIEDSDFQNDESAKIIFRDFELNTNNVLKPMKDRTSKFYHDQNSAIWANEHMKNHDVEVFPTPIILNVTKNPNENKITWPTNGHMNNHDGEDPLTPSSSNINNVKDIEEVTTPSIERNDDVLVFVYPKKEKYIASEPIATTPSKTPAEIESSFVSTEAGLEKLSSTKLTNTESQNICTYVTKTECLSLNGLVYEYATRLPLSNKPLICCILPIQPVTKKPDIVDVIYFPKTTTRNKNRSKRSGGITNLSQRDFLLKSKLPSIQNIKPIATPNTKIVTPPDDDYVDPYWNIKNTRFQNPNKPKPESPKFSYNDYSENYGQEYADEVPRPGLVGLYSDHAKSPSNWPSAGGNKGFSYGGTDDYVEDDVDDYDFGYSTVDPRRGDKTKKLKAKPQKLDTTSGELSYSPERQTINFQSNPDFQVFQGFKLLNLFRNTSKGSNKITDKDSTELSIDSGEGEELDKLFRGCGKAKKLIERGNQVGEATNGSHPWLALVVLSRRRQNVLCYAALVHPRAAVTVADCVEGTAPGDITVIAGIWNLEDRSRSRNRVATVHLHPRYKPGNAEHNVAILTGMGAPVICDEDGHSTVVGVIASRENGYYLVPVRSWVMHAESLMSGD